MRERSIVKKSEGNGCKCPKLLQEAKPCFTKGCYKWAVSDWSSCTSHKGLCGSGIQQRNISCMAEGGVPVNATHCKPDIDISILPVSNLYINSMLLLPGFHLVEV